MEPTIVKASKIGLTFIVIILGIFIIAFFFQYATTGTNFFETLGVVFKEKCQASLSISTTGECTVKAKILISNCLDKAYQISKDSCSGDTKCYGTINYDSFQASCAWKDNPGTKNYVLCVDGKNKDSAYVNC